MIGILFKIHNYCFFNFSKKFNLIQCSYLVQLQFLKQSFDLFFCPLKVEKNTLKSCSENPKSTFFPLLP